MYGVGIISPTQKGGCWVTIVMGTNDMASILLLLIMTLTRNRKSFLLSSYGGDEVPSMMWRAFFCAYMHMNNQMTKGSNRYIRTIAGPEYTRADAPAAIYYQPERDLTQQY
ncbi:hypothetical protein BDQ17DRAFT_1337724 [Cyathus striatus]|nr:hypothetical protein BDQ17DRAFT_1337724 [Cyathus striatus]